MVGGNAHRLRGESLGRKTDAWMSASSPLATSEAPCTIADSFWEVDSRTGAEQTKKLWARDDLRRPIGKLACAALKPIELGSRRRLYRISKLLNAAPRDWAFFTSDPGSSYKKIPCGRKRSKLAAIALWRQADGRRYFIFIRTLMFGASQLPFVTICFPGLSLSAQTSFTAFL